MPKITFNYFDKYAYEVQARPEPSSGVIPQWFSDMPPFFPTEDDPEGKKFKMIDGARGLSPKKCTPMLDAIISGYTISLWTDVFIKDGQMTWSVDRPVFLEHGNGSKSIPPPPGYSNMVLKYLTGFRMETPPGYSVMVKPPSGHTILPFLAVPAIIDTDKSVIDSNFPVWVIDGLQGVVEKGTPIAQVFPFKRENWTSEFTTISEEDFDIQVNNGFKKTLQNNYVKNIWSKKTFK